MLWAPSLAATIVIVDAAPTAPDDLALRDFDAVGTIVADYATRNCRHIVIADCGRHHRVCVRGTLATGPDTFVLPAGTSFATRLAATIRLERRLRGLQSDAEDMATHPTPFQRQRLILLLRLIDAALAKATRREMAFTLIYPRTTQLTGAAWKGSNERRRTMRLLANASRMMRGGYRALLQS